MNYFELLEISSKIKYLQKQLYIKIAKEYDIHHTSLEIILFLNNNKEHNTAKDICDLLDLKANLVSFHVFKLVKEGYIIREYIDNDRRKIRLFLTDKCEKIIKDDQIVREKFQNYLLNDCTNEEIENVTSFLLKIKNIINNINF